MCRSKNFTSDGTVRMPPFVSLDRFSLFAATSYSVFYFQRLFRMAFSIGSISSKLQWGPKKPGSRRLPESELLIRSRELTFILKRERSTPSKLQWGPKKPGSRRLPGSELLIRSRELSFIRKLERSTPTPRSFLGQQSPGYWLDRNPTFARDCELPT